MPSVDGRSISIVGGEDIVMTSTSSKKDAAWTFMKFMLEDAQQVAMAGAGMIPVTSSAMEKVDTSGSPYVEVYMEQLKTAQARIPCSSWPTIETILNTAFESVLRGQASSQKALDDAAAQIDALLAQECSPGFRRGGLQPLAEEIRRIEVQRCRREKENCKPACSSGCRHCRFCWPVLC